LALSLGTFGFAEFFGVKSEVEGRPYVVDGDTIQLSGIRIRLDGIDAPESDQQCRDRAGIKYHCGRITTHALEHKISAQSVRCELHGQDHFGRQLGRCFVGDTDLAEWMVREGHAVAYWRYSWRYVPAEIIARLNEAGIWQGDFERPSDWRQVSKDRDSR
jgi:endonuclease YncB( thermonuclease family)